MAAASDMMAVSGSADFGGPERRASAMGAVLSGGSLLALLLGTLSSDDAALALLALQVRDHKHAALGPAPTVSRWESLFLPSVAS